MSSNKKKREKIKAKRAICQSQHRSLKRTVKLQSVPPTERVNVAALAHYNSYGIPLFVERGYYVDLAFTCKECGAREIWTASQQKWWYEVAKGYVDSRAVRCAACRKKNRENRKKSLEGARQKRLKTQ